MLELMVSVGIIGMGMVMFAQFTGMSVNDKVVSSREDTAITLAQDKIEDIKNIALTIRLDHGFTVDTGKVNPDYTPSHGWASLDDEVLDEEGTTITCTVTQVATTIPGVTATVEGVTTTTDSVTTFRSFETCSTLSGPTFTRSWDVAAVSGAYYLYDVTVDVEWNEGGSDSVTLTTRIAQ